MDYYNPDTRAAYLAGASEAYETRVLQLPAAAAREVEAWLNDLRRWTSGPPPDAPYRWSRV